MNAAHGEPSAVPRAHSASENLGNTVTAPGVTRQRACGRTVDGAICASSRHGAGSPLRLSAVPLERVLQLIEERPARATTAVDLQHGANDLVGRLVAGPSDGDGGSRGE